MRKLLRRIKMSSYIAVMSWLFAMQLHSSAQAAASCNAQSGITTIGIEFIVDQCVTPPTGDNTSFHYIDNALECSGGNVSLFASYGDDQMSPASLIGYWKSAGYKIFRNREGTHIVAVDRRYTGLIDGKSMSSYSAGQVYTDVFKSGFVLPSTPDCQGGDFNNSCPVPAASSVTLGTGRLSHSQALFATTSSQPLALNASLYYRSIQFAPSTIGNGWSHNYEISLQTGANGSVTLWIEGRRRIYTLYGNIYYPPTGDFSTLVKNSDGTYSITEKDGLKRNFSSSGTITSLVDRNGNTLTFTYTSGKLTTITDPNGRSAILAYDANNKLTTITDPKGNVYTFAYTGGSLTSVTNPDSGQWKYSYGANGLLATKIDPENNQSSYVYGANNRLASATGPDGKARSYTFPALVTTGKIPDAYPQSVLPRKQFVFTEKDGGSWSYSYDTRTETTSSKTDALGNVYSYTYDSQGNMLTKTEPRIGTTTYTYDAKGNVLSIKNPLNQTTSYTYNDLGQVLTTTDANNRTTTNSYDTNGNLLQTIDPKGAKTVFSYDSKGNLLTQTDPLGNITTFTYDTDSNPIAIKDTSGGITTFTYDANGNILTTKDPADNTTTYTYDALNRLTIATDPLGNITQFAYDKNGNRITTTDANGNNTTSTYNFLNLPLTIKDATGNTTTMAYSGSGCSSCGGGGADKLVSVTDASNNTTKYEYDQLGRKTKEIDPNAHITSFSYNADSTLASRTDTNGHTTAYTYDTNGHLLSRTYSDGTSNTFTYDAAGNLITATNAAISYTLGYDATNRLTSVTDNLGRTISYVLDANGNRTQMTAPDGRITTYAYDAKNRLTQLTDNGNAYVFTYDALDRRTKLTNPNGTYTTYSYDADNRMTSLVTQTSTGTIINSISHDYDKTANRTTKVEPAGTTAYSYDPVYRLLKSALGTTTKELFTYDATGNRTSGPQASTTYTIDQGNQLAAYPNVTLTYDNNGNITGKTTLNGTYTYLYDDENRLTELRFNGSAIATYKYDPFGRRIEKNVASPATTYKYLYDGANILYEYDGSNAIKTRYTHNLATDDPLAIEANGTLYTYHKDTLSSVRALTDSTQATINTYRYDSFGNTTQAGTLLQPYAYTGREWDWETGLYYYRARTYDSRIGRFISKDPISFAGGDVNLYGYVSNNPVNYADPSGLTAAVPAPVPFPPLPPVVIPGTPENKKWTDSVIYLLRKAKEAIDNTIKDICKSRGKDEKADRCHERCEYLLAPKYNDLQSSAYRKCYQQCMGWLN